MWLDHKLLFSIIMWCILYYFYNNIHLLYNIKCWFVCICVWMCNTRKPFNWSPKNVTHICIDLWRRFIQYFRFYNYPEKKTDWGFPIWHSLELVHAIRKLNFPLYLSTDFHQTQCITTEMLEQLYKLYVLIVKGTGPEVKNTTKYIRKIHLFFVKKFGRLQLNKQHNAFFMERVKLNEGNNTSLLTLIEI